MPLDSVTTVRRASVAVTIGLVPVPAVVLKAHMESVQEHWRSYWARKRGYEHRAGLVHWEVIQSRRTDDLLASVQIFAGSADPVPKAVRTIAADSLERARNAGVQDAELVAGYCCRDPYVSLRYRKGSKTAEYCLAIWDGKKVLNIAKLT